MKLATNIEDVLDAIDTLNDSLAQSPDLAARLGQAHAYYAKVNGGSGHRFGFSKFIGYTGLSASSYLSNYKELDGRNTEFSLGRWFEEVRYGSPLYRLLFDELASWMATYGKKPREGGQQKLRIMVLKPEFDAAPPPTGDDRQLLDLLVAVAQTLPIAQRRQLRATL